MMNNNKILTVSYGTFSCTLEGFDDSFGTMKAIAEYFRDLASDDRYFGAEPPQPDAEMLARIAQKEISRRVEAREDDGRIVLSAQEDVQPAAPAAAPLAVAAAAAVETAETETAPTALQAEPEAVAKPDTESVPETAAEPEASVEPEVSDAAADVEPIAETPAVAAVEEKEVLADTAATDVATVVEDARVAEDNAPDVEIEENVVAVEEEIAPALESEVEPEEEEPQVAEAPSEPEVEAPVLTAETDTPAADVFEDETTEDAAEAFFANSVLPEDENADEEALYADMAQVQDDVPVAEAVAVETPAIPESIADKLKRIRAVVSQGPIASTQDAEYDAEDGTPATASEDFMSDFMSTPDVDTPQDDPHTSAIAEAAADIESAFEADDAIAEHDAAQDDEDAFVQDISSALERFDAVANDRSDIADATDKAEEEVIDLTGYEVDDAEDDTAADFADLTAETSDEEDIEDVLDNLFEKEDTVQDVLQDEEDETDALMAAATAMNGPAEKTDAPDARLMKVQSSDIENVFEQYVEDAEDHADSTLQADVASAAEDNRSAVDSLPKLEEGQDTDLSRLMAEADSQMKEPESAGRRKAFAHLRAAVAAKKADRQMGTDDTLEASDQPYRSDLADAVKPRRPIVGATSRTERPAMDATSAPLKLVAEQRVDVQRPDGPVKPRRIAASQEELIADAAGESFNTFADEMGATKLPELLEAAAAYLSFVEGHDQFSRPQLMTKVRQVENETFSREDSLRSFGQLLRSGKIQKIKGGRFTVSEDIGFKPDERAAS